MKKPHCYLYFLILKKARHLEIMEFHAISLVRDVYKFISKVLELNESGVGKVYLQLKISSSRGDKS